MTTSFVDSSNLGSHKILYSVSETFSIFEYFLQDDEAAVESDHRDLKGTKGTAMAEKNAARLTALLLLEGIQQQSYCFAIFQFLQLSGELFLRKELSIVPVRNNTDQLDNAKLQYTSVAKTPGNGRVYAGTTPKTYKATVST